MRKKLHRRSQYFGILHNPFPRCEFKSSCLLFRKRIPACDDVKSNLFFAHEWGVVGMFHLNAEK